MSLWSATKTVLVFVLWCALAIGVLIISLYLAGCDPERLDEGWMQKDGITLQPGIVPKGIMGDSSLEPDNLEHIVVEAATWWNEQAGIELFFTPTPTPDVTVEVNFIALPSMPDDMMAVVHQGDLAEVHFARFDGAVQSCHIILNVDLAYHEETMRQSLKHGMGHCLGLGDDPGIDRTVELRSIMSNPLDPLGELTRGDRERLLQEADRAE